MVLVVRLVAILPSVVLVFLPFTYDVSPLQGIRERELFPLAAPFFLSVAILLGALVLRWGKERMVLLLACYLLAAGALASTTLFLAQVREHSVADLVAWPVLLLCSICILVLSKRRLQRGDAALAALMAGWIPNAVLCCLGFWGTWQLGGYVTALTILVFATWVVRSVRQPVRLRGRQP